VYDCVIYIVCYILAYIRHSLECLHLVVVGGGGLRASMTLRAMPAGTYVPGRASQAGQAVKSEARLREINWSSKNGGFADELVTLPRKIKYS
jgi:hypothetical protein